MLVVPWLSKLFVCAQADRCVRNDGSVDRTRYDKVRAARNRPPLPELFDELIYAVRHCLARLQVDQGCQRLILRQADELELFHLNEVEEAFKQRNL